MSAQSSRTASPLPANVRSIAKIQNDLKDLDLTSKFSSESLLRLGRLLAKEGYSESELAHLDRLTGWGSVLLNRCIGPQTETQYLEDEAVETGEALSLHPIDRLDVLKSSLHHYNKSLQTIDSIARLKNTESFLNDMERKLAQDEEKPDLLDILEIVSLDVIYDTAITGYWVGKLTSLYEQQALDDLPKGEQGDSEKSEIEKLISDIAAARPRSSSKHIDRVVALCNRVDELSLKADSMKERVCSGWNDLATTATLIKTRDMSRFADVTRSLLEKELSMAGPGSGSDYRESHYDQTSLSGDAHTQCQHLGKPEPTAPSSMTIEEPAEHESASSVSVISPDSVRRDGQQRSNRTSRTCRPCTIL